jgi:hypothetical protein
MNEPSHYIDILIDTGDDTICIVTRYRFETPELATQFITHVEKTNYIVSSSVFSEKSRCTSITRPRFSDLDLAIEDLKQCVDYCFDKTPYPYSDTIENEPIIQYMIIHFEKLREENRQLREENERLRNQ